MTEWFETLDDRLWLRPDDMGEDEAFFIRKALHLRPGHKVLDAPCGAGRISFHLARAGCAVTGVDLRQSFIDRARRRCRNAHTRGTFLVMDMRKINFENQFHGVFNWFGSFGYFSEAENARLIQSYARALRHGGRLILEQVNREYILRHFIAERRNDGITMRNRWNVAKQRIITRRIVDGENDPRNLSSLRLYTPAQMMRLLENNGMTIETISGSIQGEPFKRSSRRMIVVARKTTTRG